MKLLMVFFTGVLTSVAYGSVTDGSLCPQTFTGKVKEVLEEVGPEDPFSKNHVIFENNKEQITVDVLKNGPYQLEKGRAYRVQLRNGKLCSIEEV